jgi:quinol-cytochrome oxidoreductase complex cytochrome b subunit
VSSLPPIQIVESADPLATPRRIALVRPDIRPAVRRREERWVMTFPHLIVREVILFQLVVIGLAVAAMLFDAPLQGIANPLETPNPAKAPWYFLGLQELLHYFPPVVAGVLMPGLVVVALVVIPYARVNLTAGPLWASRPRRTAIAMGTVTALLVLLLSVFACWPIVVPTVALGLAVFAARGGERGGRLRQRLASVTLPEWIMTWFVVVATILTVIGTFFRGPGWSLVWPWNAAVFG